MASTEGPITLPGNHQDHAEGVPSREKQPGAQVVSEHLPIREKQPGAQITILEAIAETEQEAG
jgi:hypothetical protein